MRLASDLIIQRLLVKMWRGYHLNRVKKKKEKKGNVGYLQSAETIDKAPICNIFVILSQTPFLGKENDDDNKIK